MNDSFTSEDLAAEEWRPCTESDTYEVSSLGRVRSNARAGAPAILRGGRQGRGYHSVTLFCAGKPRSRLVHRLVLLAFADAPAPGQETAHLDGDKSNNRLSNLAWVTHAENVEHQVLHGTRRFGERNGAAKLSNEDVRNIRGLFGAVTLTEIARRFNVSVSAVWLIRSGRKWGAVA